MKENDLSYLYNNMSLLEEHSIMSLALNFVESFSIDDVYSQLGQLRIYKKMYFY